MTTMRSSWVLATIGLLVLAATGGAEAAPVSRISIDQKGDFVVFGSTLGHDCSTMNPVPAPTVGTVTTCPTGANANDSSPDLFWRSEDATATANTTHTAATARTTAMLVLPAGATVSYARLYWSAPRSGAVTDTTATLERPGAGGFLETVTASDSVTAVADGVTYYQSSADVTALLRMHGAGAYRVGGVDAAELRAVDQDRRYAAWSIVAFYTLATDPLRNLTLFDGLDIIQPSTPMVTVNLSGFLVPSAGFDAKLAVLTYEGDDSITGDSIAVNGTRLTNALNPTLNFFNNTRSDLGVAVSNAGDLPRLTGGARSMSGFDLDIVDIKDRLMMGQQTATVVADTTGDFYILGAFVTSISTFKPDFSTTLKTVTNVTRADAGANPGVRPNDVLEYTISTTNNGNDPGQPVVLTDVLPAGVTFVPGSIQITAGPNMGAKTDVAGDDQAEYNAATRTVTVRLGNMANQTMGGELIVGASTTVSFRVTVNANATGTISNQAVINAAGKSGAPPANYPSDGNGMMPGIQTTDTPLDECQVDGDCPGGRFCFNTSHPFVCSECRSNADCTVPVKPVCDTATHVCRACTMDSECSGATPICDNPPGRCVGCRTSADCSGLTPLCVAATGTCGPCTGDGPAGGCVDPKRPACNTVLPLAGACTECSGTNSTLCGGAKPQCQTQVGLCGCSDRDGDMECGTANSGIICNGPVGICVPGCSEAPMRNRCPSPQMCSATGGPVGSCIVPVCIGDLDCRQPRPKCDLTASPRTCVGCLVDLDCTAGYVCDTGASKTCVECTATKTQNCTATNAGSRCLVNDTCGCMIDGDCGSNISGRVCDANVNKCTYGCRGVGGNGCPSGLICTSTTMDIGRCLPPGAADAGVSDAAPDVGPDTAPDLMVGVVDAAEDAPVDMAAATPDAEVDAGAPDAAALADATVPRDLAPFPDAFTALDFGPNTGDDSGNTGGVPRGSYVAGGGCKCEAGRGSAGGDGTGLLAVLMVPVALIVARRRRRR